MKADIEKHGKIKVFQDVRSFEGADLIVFWKDLKASPLASNVTHAAIIPMKIKAFERSQIESAREWLKKA